MLYVPNGWNDFSWRVDSNGTTRPPGTGGTWGTAITPAENSKGNYSAAILSALARDVFGLLIHFSANNSNNNARDTIVDIGADPAGGTSYAVVIPDLLASCAGGVAHGVWYYFPLYIPAGSTVAARASINNATVGTLRCRLIGFGSPRNRTRLKYGSKVTAYGIVSASSAGTAVTPGAGTEGAWTSLGTTSARHWWWQCGVGVNDSTMTSSNGHFADLSIGDGTNYDLVIENKYYYTATATEDLNCHGVLGVFVDCERVAPSGAGIYGRLHCNTAPDSGFSMAAYGLS